MTMTPELPVAEIAAHAAWRHPLERLLDSTGEGIYGVDLDGRCIFINRAGADLLGYRPGELLGRNMHEVMHHSRPDGAPYPVDECPIYNAFRAGKACRLDEDVLWRADGGSFCAEYSSYPIFERGAITGAVVTFVDITERKRAQEMLREARDQLEQRVAERTRELTRALAELARSHARLRELSGHLQAVREEERRRIAREIHDELGSVLVALKMDLGWLQRKLEGNAGLVMKTAAMAKLIDTAVVDLGRIITDLRPSILDHQGLWAALEWYAHEFLRATGLRGQLDVDVRPTAPRPEESLAIATYRIFQEILNNVARHASATAVQMLITADERALTIRVRDNGQGVTLEQLRRVKSHGVLGMSERARHFGGKLEIGPLRGGGTRVYVSIPFNGKPNDDPTVDL